MSEHHSKSGHDGHIPSGNKQGEEHDEHKKKKGHGTEDGHDEDIDDVKERGLEQIVGDFFEEVLEKIPKTGKHVGSTAPLKTIVGVFEKAYETKAGRVMQALCNKMLALKVGDKILVDLLTDPKLSPEAKIKKIQTAPGSMRVWTTFLRAWFEILKKGTERFPAAMKETLSHSPKLKANAAVRFGGNVDRVQNVFDILSFMGNAITVSQLINIKQPILYISVSTVLSLYISIMSRAFRDQMGTLAFEHAVSGKEGWHVSAALKHMLFSGRNPVSLIRNWTMGAVTLTSLGTSFLAIAMLVNGGAARIGSIFKAADESRAKTGGQMTKALADQVEAARNLIRHAGVLEKAPSDAAARAGLEKNMQELGMDGNPETMFSGKAERGDIAKAWEDVAGSTEFQKAMNEAEAELRAINDELANRGLVRTVTQGLLATVYAFFGASDDVVKRDVEAGTYTAITGNIGTVQTVNATHVEPTGATPSPTPSPGASPDTGNTAPKVKEQMITLKVAHEQAGGVTPMSLVEKAVQVGGKPSIRDRIRQRQERLKAAMELAFGRVSAVAKGKDYAKAMALPTSLPDIRIEMDPNSIKVGEGALADMWSKFLEAKESRDIIFFGSLLLSFGLALANEFIFIGSLVDFLKPFIWVRRRIRLEYLRTRHKMNPENERIATAFEKAEEEARWTNIKPAEDHDSAPYRALRGWLIKTKPESMHAHGENIVESIEAHLRDEVTPKIHEFLETHAEMIKSLDTDWKMPDEDAIYERLVELVTGPDSVGNKRFSPWIFVFRPGNIRRFFGQPFGPASLDDAYIAQLGLAELSKKFKLTMVDAKMIRFMMSFFPNIPSAIGAMDIEKEKMHLIARMARGMFGLYLINLYRVQTLIERATGGLTSATDEVVKASHAARRHEVPGSATGQEPEAAETDDSPETPSTVKPIKPPEVQKAADDLEEEVDEWLNDEKNAGDHEGNEKVRKAKSTIAALRTRIAKLPKGATKVAATLMDKIRSIRDDLVDEGLLGEEELPDEMPEVEQEAVVGAELAAQMDTIAHVQPNQVNSENASSLTKALNAMSSTFKQATEAGAQGRGMRNAMLATWADLRELPEGTERRQIFADLNLHTTALRRAVAERKAPPKIVRPPQTGAGGGRADSLTTSPSSQSEPNAAPVPEQDREPSPEDDNREVIPEDDQGETVLDMAILAVITRALDDVEILKKFVDGENVDPRDALGRLRAFLRTNQQNATVRDFVYGLVERGWGGTWKEAQQAAQACITAAHEKLQNAETPKTGEFMPTEQHYSLAAALTELQQVTAKKRLSGKQRKALELVEAWFETSPDPTECTRLVNAIQDPTKGHSGLWATNPYAAWDEVQETFQRAQARAGNRKGLANKVRGLLRKTGANLGRGFDLITLKKPAGKPSGGRPSGTPATEQAPERASELLNEQLLQVVESLQYLAKLYDSIYQQDNLAGKGTEYEETQVRSFVAQLRGLLAGQQATGLFRLLRERPGWGVNDNATRTIVEALCEEFSIDSSYVTDQATALGNRLRQRKWAGIASGSTEVHSLIASEHVFNSTIKEIIRKSPARAMRLIHETNAALDANPAQ